MNRPVVYTLDQQSIQALSQMIFQLRHEVMDLRLRVNGRRVPDAPRPTAVGRVATQITAISGTTTFTPGSGTVTLYARDGTTLASRETVTAYSLIDAAIPVDTWVYLYRDRHGDWWILNVGDASFGGIEDLRLNGTDFQYLKNGTWTTWVSGTECP